MQSPLLRCAATIASPDAPLIVIGLDEPPVLRPVLPAPVMAVSEAEARRLAGLAMGDTASLLSRLIAATGLTEKTMSAAVVIVVPGQGAGWTMTDGAALTATLAPLVSAILVLGQLAGPARTPAGLGELLTRAGAALLFSGWLPSNDCLASGRSVAIVQPLPLAPPPTVTAMLRTYNAAPTLDYTLQWLANEGIEAMVMDAGSNDQSVEVAETWLGRGVLSLSRAGTPEEAAFLEDEVVASASPGWLVRLRATDRIEGPWPELGLRATLGRFAAADWNAAKATTVLMGTGPGDDGRSDPARGPRLWRFALPDADASPIATLGGSAADQVSPYNLLIRRYPPAATTHPSPLPTSGDWDPWDEAARAQFLVERLTGHGIFHHRFPAPPECSWFADETLLTWRESAIKGTLCRLPDPDPLAPSSGTVRLNWERPDGGTAALYVGNDGSTGVLSSRASEGFVTIDGINPNRTYRAALYRDETRDHLLGELRFGVQMGVEEMSAPDG